MNSTREWDVTQQMLLGDFSCDFNPFHDPKDGRFTSGHKLGIHTNKRTRMVKESYYQKVANDLGVSLEEAKDLADAINEYTRHSTEFRRWSRDPERYAMVNGPEAAARQQAMMGKMESFIEKSPKWSGGKLYRGIEFDEAGFDRFIAGAKSGEVVDLGGPTSWSSDKRVSSLFAGAVRGIDINGEKKAVILVTNKRTTDQGTSIRHLSGAPTDEKEVLVSGKASFVPSGRVVDLGHVAYVYGDIE